MSDNSSYNPDIIESARDYVNEKSLFDRIVNSSALSDLRKAKRNPLSVVKKYKTKILSGMASAVIPGGGFAVGIAADVLDDTVDRHYKKYQKSLSEGDLAAIAKIAVKNIDSKKIIENRVKAEAALKEMNEAISIFNSSNSQEILCDEYYIISKILAQAERRLNLLERDAFELAMISTHLYNWVRSCQTNSSPGNVAQEIENAYEKSKIIENMTTLKGHIRNKIDYEITEKTLLEIQERHKNCKDWCIFKTGKGMSIRSLINSQTTFINNDKMPVKAVGYGIYKPKSSKKS